MDVIGRRAMVIHASGVLRVRVLEARLSAVLLVEEFFHFPRVGLDADGKFQIFLGDVIPELQRSAMPMTVGFDWWLTL